MDDRTSFRRRLAWLYPFLIAGLWWMTTNTMNVPIRTGVEAILCLAVALFPFVVTGYPKPVWKSMLADAGCLAALGALVGIACVLDIE